MKTNLLSPTLALLLVFTCAAGAPLTQTTAVHTKPDDAAPAINYLKAGSEPMPAASGLASTPAGWMAVELKGPFQGYVETKDFTKGLDVKPGTAVRLEPRPDAPILTMAEQGDKTSITGLHGRWTQISLEKDLVGYIKVGNTRDYLPPIATTAASSAEPMPAPATPPTYGTTGPGQPVAMTAGDGTASLPRQVAGIFVSTRSLFHPRRPYDWALNDDAGRRYAYLDLSKLLQTDSIEKYIGHRVVVFGAAKPTADGKDIVIQVDSLQLR